MTSSPNLKRMTRAFRTSDRTGRFFALRYARAVNAPRVAVAWETGLDAEAQRLAAELALPLLEQGEADLLLVVTPGRLELREVSTTAGPVYADFASGRAAHRRLHGGGRGQLLARAVGLKGNAPLTVVDATAGLGQDAFVLASLGAQVTLLERSPVVGALLRNALSRAHATPEVADIAARMTLIVGDAATLLGTLPPPDVVVLDPMYPHRTKSALPKKEMRVFRRLVGADDDAGQLLDAARRAALRRVVVKRPAGAPFLADTKPDGRLESKNTRFDLYLVRSQRK